MVYKSKIGWGLWGPIIALVVILSITTIVASEWPGLLIILLASGFVFYIFNNIFYEIKGGTLIVHTGFTKMVIDVDTIKSIEPTNTFLSAPALSLNRIEVFYNRFDSVVISPVDTDAFIDHLQSVNRAIVLTANKN